MRVTKTEFYEIFDMVKDELSRDNSTSREGIGAKEQLVITLRYFTIFLILLVFYYYKIVNLNLTAWLHSAVRRSQDEIV